MLTHQDGHSKQADFNTGDIIDSFSAVLGRFAAKGKLPKECKENKWGIDVMYSHKYAGMVMFHFITKDDLEVELPFLFSELNEKGRVYLDERIEILISQLDEARKERASYSTIYLPSTQSALTAKESKVAQAVIKSAATEKHVSDNSIPHNRTIN